jgi:hypothetical protein
MHFSSSTLLLALASTAIAAPIAVRQVPDVLEGSVSSLAGTAVPIVESTYSAATADVKRGVVGDLAPGVDELITPLGLGALAPGLDSTLTVASADVKRGLAADLAPGVDELVTPLGLGALTPGLTSTLDVASADV